MIVIKMIHKHMQGVSDSPPGRLLLEQEQSDSFILTQSASRSHSHVLNPARFIEELQPATTCLSMFNSIDVHLSFQHDVTTKRLPGKLV